MWDKNVANDSCYKKFSQFLIHQIISLFGKKDSTGIFSHIQYQYMNKAITKEEGDTEKKNLPQRSECVGAGG